MINKVVAFIVRKKENDHQLLIFKHPTAGFQMPKGTVEENETVETALIREVTEETGLKKLEIVKKLGESTKYADQNEAVLTQSLRLFSWPAQAAKRHGPLCTRGLILKTFEKKVGFTRVKYEEFDFNKQPPMLLSVLEGWLPGDVLTREINHHFYLLKSMEETPDHWNIQSDLGNILICQWVNVNSIPELIGEQAEWLSYLESVDFED